MIDRSLEKAALQNEIASGRCHAALIINTRSRRGAAGYLEVKSLLAKSKLKIDTAFPIDKPATIIDTVGELLARGQKFIIIGGGDGTISSVVDHFAYARVLFGVLPLGTANSFARALKIPLDLGGAIDVLVNGKVADVDLGKINEDYFANGSSMGLPAAVGRATPHKLKKWLGRSAYALVGAKEFIRHQSFQCVVTIDERQTSFEALDVRIASGSYQGGVLVAPEAKPDNGEIIVYIMKGHSRWVIAREWARLALGVPFRPADAELLKASTLLIDAVPKQDVVIDGEVIAQTPVRVSVARNALLLMVPQTYEDF